LLFRPLRSVTPATEAGRVIVRCARAAITLFSAHTNLDFAPGGTSAVLADTLGIAGAVPLHPAAAVQCKVVTYVPASSVDRVADAMSAAGAGVIGQYTDCSFRSEGTGTFRGSATSRPAVGTPGRRETVREVRLEMVAPVWRQEPVLQALRSAHPYEEVAVDVFPSDTPHPGMGAGAIGSLRAPLSPARFLTHVRTALGARALRFARGARGPIRRVAVCGGGGMDLLPKAIAAGADAFVTADVRYHAFHEAEGRILLVDAGHFETEFPVVRALERRLREHFRAAGVRVPVHVASAPTNPVHSE
jgi:putative NIF3 family GTP cyclohydrolase 1 type 2